MTPYDHLYHTIVKHHELESSLYFSFMEQEQRKILFEVLGYTEVSYSWYDGPLLSIRDGDISIAYGACIDVTTYKFIDERINCFVSLYSAYNALRKNVDDPFEKPMYYIVGYDESIISRPYVDLNLHQKMFLRKLNKYFASKSNDVTPEYHYPRLAIMRKK